VFCVGGDLLQDVTFLNLVAAITSTKYVQVLLL
jgi:hypothetical protein